MIAVHVTHEAVEKMGGIGAVIGGLVTSPAYQKAFPRTVLVGPMFSTDHPADERLGPGGRILYSSLDGIDTNGLAGKFRPIEQSYQVGLVYGIRQVTDGIAAQPAEVEVLLVDVFSYNRDRLNVFKGELFAKFGVACDRFEGIWEFEQYVRLAEPAYHALHAIGCSGTAEKPLVLFAHEYMGMPTALKAVLDGRPHVRTVFYAHEVATVRKIVEDHEGHDLMFYNLLEAGERAGKSLEDYFPDVRSFFKHPLIKASRHCDVVFAVGDMVARELRFLDRSCHDLPVEMVYNGVPAGRQTLSERRERRARMKRYAANLFGFEPDYTFAHVARPVLSKGIWRDLRVLHELEGWLAREHKSVVYFMLGTLAGQRRTKDVLHMERLYGWPVHHTLGYPDLCNGEEQLEALFHEFNRTHEHARAVLVNQFGWSRRVGGLRMPEHMTFADIRQGTDVEFGMSVYEPFGISQLEPLSFGAICVISNVCGCASFARHCAAGRLPANVLEADFTKLPEGMDAEAWNRVGRELRDRVEAEEGRRVAEELSRRLPRTELQVADLLQSGWELGRLLAWDRVVETLFLPALDRASRIDVLDETMAAK